MSEHDVKPVEPEKPDPCEVLDKQPHEVGEAVYALAKAIEEHRNRGFSVHDMKQWGDPDLNFDVLKCERAWKDMLFFADGRRRDDFDGWGVRKRPHWSLAWGQMYGWQSEIGEQLLVQAWDEAQAEYEKRRVRRTNEFSTLGAFEQMETITVAYYAACFDVLWRRYRHHNWGAGRPGAFYILMQVCADLGNDFIQELYYRTKAQPEERTSKKKTQAAREDFKQAGKYLFERTRHFFTDAFVAQSIQMSEEPDLSVDFEHLPKMPAEQTPVMWKSDGEVVKDFMRFLEESQPGTFEWEDAQLILKNLRATLARARGQPTEAVIRREENTGEVES